MTAARLDLDELEARDGPAALMPADRIPVAPAASYDLPPPVYRDDAIAADPGVPVTAHGPILPGVVERIAAAVRLAPRAVLAAVAAAGSGVVVTAGPVTDWPPYATLAGVPVPGDPRQTYADAVGLGGAPGVPAVVRQSATPKQILHELAHTYDAVSGYPSASPAWAEWHARLWYGLDVPAEVGPWVG